MPYYCTVPRCTSMAGKAKNVSFHQFPRDEELAKLWNKILKRGKPYTKYSKVCSLHFTADDYTITSVGKNKGQWRTLRKDAIPSQNLPSESPTPYQRKQWSSWAHSPTTNVMDPTIQQQVAQAIYMQTMLAMQAAGPTELPGLNHANGLPLPLPTESFAHTSTAPDTDILKGKQTNTEQNTSYKCTECSKCFKDPDVFILHKRTHIKNEKNEKENFNLNVTLQANPILANLLKTNPENSNIFDNNLMSVESLLMTALAANMEGYMRNFTSIMKGEHRSLVDHDRHELDHDRDMMDHSRDMMDHGRDMMDQDRGIMGRGRDEVDHDRGMMNNDDNESDDTEDLNHDQNILNHVTTHLDRRGNYNQNNLDLKPAFNEDCQSMMQKRALDHARGIPNDDRSYMSHDSGQMSHDIDLINQNRGSNLADRDNTVFQNSILENFRNKASNISFKNVNLNGSTRNEIEIGNFYRGVIDCDRTVTDHERVMTDDDNDDGITNDDDSQGSNAGPVCDSDLNESIDSNKLVIDENV